MQTQLARLLLASRACNNLAACMPCLSVYPRTLSSLSSPLSDALRPTEASAGVREGLSAVQAFSCQHMPYLTSLTDRSIPPPAFVPVRAACTPFMPAQLQAAVRVAQVQQLASMCPSIPGLEDGPAGHTEDMLCATKRTYQPSVIIRKRRHGFLNRVSTRGGRNVLRRRKAKGRYNITA